MKNSFSSYLPSALALVGLSVCCLLLWNQTARFRKSVERIAQGVRVTLIDMDGKVVYDSTGQNLPNHAARAEFEAVRTDGQARSIVRDSDTLHIAMFYHARRAGNYVLRIAVPYQSVTEAKASAVSGLLAAIGIGALVSLAIFFIMRRFERRLSRLSIERDMQDNLLAKMRSLEEFRSDFISNVTHEIKTPVTGILGAVDVFSDGYSDLDEPDRWALLKVMKDQSVRLNALVEDILSLAQLEKAEATQATDFTDCNLVDVIQTAVNLARPQAAEAGIEIRLDLPTRLIRACEPRLIESAVSNLLQNAIRYSGSKSVDVVAKEQPDGTVSVSVTDYGIGIPIDCQGRLFERFFRVDRDRSRLLGGTGLGLAIVKHIVQLHNGEVSVVSKPGAGATFQIVI